METQVFCPFGGAGLQDAALALVPVIYDGLLTPNGFQETFKQLRVALDVPAAGISFRTATGVEQTWVGLEPSFENAYLRHYHRSDPWVAAWNRGQVKCGELFGSERLTPAETQHNPCYQELCVPHGYHDLIGSVLENTDRMVAVSAFVRGEAEHQANVRAVLQLLLPHFHCAAQLHLRNRELQGQAGLANDLLERFPTAVLAVDRQGRVLRTNRQAQQLLSKQDGVAADARGVRLANADLTGRLVLALVRGQAVTLRAPRPSGASPYAVVVAPCGEQGSASAGGASALLYVLDSDAQHAPPATLLRDLFGLTPAEARLALELAHGASPRDAANRLGVTWNTTRTQLKAVLAKTGTNRQAALVRLLAALSVVQDREP
jgi:DNA-binding CsgD family transcriptional regulator/PAS domain-containing protein